MPVPTPLDTLDALRLAAAGLPGITPAAAPAPEGDAAVVAGTARVGTHDLVRLAVRALLDATAESTTELAAVLGVNRSQASRRLNGQAAWSLEDCDRAAAHFGIPVLALFCGPFAAFQLLPADRRRPASPGEALLARHYGLPLTDAVATALPPTFTPLPAPVPPPATTPVAVGADGQHPTTPAAVPGPVPAAVPVPPPAVPGADYDRGPDGEPLTYPATACEQCGRPVSHRITGRPLHLGGWCTPAPGRPAPAGPAAATEHPPTPPAPPRPPAPATPTAPATPPAPAAPAMLPAPVTPAGPPAPSARSATHTELLALVEHAVERELTKQQGDVTAATAALLKKAIPDAMALLAASRAGSRYEHTDHPPLPDILKKPSRAGADQIWEARPKWKNTTLTHHPENQLHVAALDMNGAYLAALKSHLPIGPLKHDTTGHYDPRQAGAYLITPPAWNHDDLPNPLGARDEPGPLWITSSTLRTLLRLAGTKYGLCDAPVIHEAWTAYSSENLLENFRRVLADARDTAIAADDTVTLEYVKAMYSKFVSTIGLSTANHRMKRPDWMHIIRAQAFANLWWKGLKAHDAGLTLVQMTGTDELHVTGDWRKVFPEGRKITEVKLKDTYTLGTTG
ncbi:helix-turn-helix domain-containing protein [Kitasatospora sp. NPDC058162]|uniref:helix-turn-helix domain-containing protein n=1 Tax=Kitasatospora sp. NPDC058162 TaxID=3346362 RepID=UPI0036DE24EC